MSIQQVPADILLQIFSYKNYIILCRLELVCKKWRELIAKSENLWKNQFDKEFGGIPEVPSSYKLSLKAANANIKNKRFCFERNKKLNKIVVPLRYGYTVLLRKYLKEMPDMVSQIPSYHLEAIVEKGFLHVLKELDAVNFPFSNERNLLTKAVTSGHLEIVRFLLSKPNVGLNSLFLYAIQTISIPLPPKFGLCSPSIILFEFQRFKYDKISLGEWISNFHVLEYDFTMKIKSLDNLWIAAQNGRLDTVKYLIEKGIDVNQNNLSPLVFAVSENRIEVVQYLLSLPQIKKETISTALFLNNRYILNYWELLIKHGGDFNSINNNKPFLHYAFSSLLESDLEKLIPLLNKYEANWQIRDSTNNSLLHLGRRQYYKLFLSKGIAIDCINDASYQPIHEAVKNGAGAAVMELLSLGASPNAQTKEKQTPLHLTTSDAVAKFLLDKGALLTMIDQDGNYPLHSAVIGLRFSVVRAFLAAGADLSVLNGKGQSPVDIALANKSMEMCQILYKFGAKFPEETEDKEFLNHVKRILLKDS